MVSCGTKFQAAAAVGRCTHSVDAGVVIVSYPAEETIVIIARRPCIYEEQPGILFLHTIFSASTEGLQQHVLQP